MSMLYVLALLAVGSLGMLAYNRLFVRRLFWPGPLSYYGIAQRTERYFICHGWTVEPKELTGYRYLISNGSCRFPTNFYPTNTHIASSTIKDMCEMVGAGKYCGAVPLLVVAEPVPANIIHQAMDSWVLVLHYSQLKELVGLNPKSVRDVWSYFRDSRIVAPAPVHLSSEFGSSDTAYSDIQQEITAPESNSGRTDVTDGHAANGTVFSLLDATLGQEIRLDEIISRSGFHDFEPIGLAWIESQRPTIVFQAPKWLLRFTIRLYRPSRDYPLDDITLTLNGTQIRHQPRILDERWAVLESAYVSIDRSTNELAMDVPLFIPASLLNPDSKDVRSLAFAVGSIAFHRDTTALVE